MHEIIRTGLPSRQFYFIMIMFSLVRKVIMTGKYANHKGAKLGAGIIAGAAGIAAMFSVVAPANAATVKEENIGGGGVF